MITYIRILVILPLFVCLAGADCSCGAGDGAKAGDRTTLPAPRLSGSVSLEESLFNRRSPMYFGSERLTLEQISQLLWAAQGITGYLYSLGLRTAPSAGALYPLEVYVATPDGVYHYHPADHEIELIKTGNLIPDIQKAGLDQRVIGEAPAVFIITAVYARTEIKYGDRAERYVKLEAGHAAQNILLQAVALNLVGRPIGAYDDEQLQTLIGAPADHEPLYLILVGHLGDG